MKRNKLSLEDWVNKKLKDNGYSDSITSFMIEDILGVFEFIIEDYLEDLPDNEVMDLSFDQKEFAFLIENALFKLIDTEKLNRVIKKESLSIAKDAVTILKKQKENIKVCQANLKRDKSKKDHINKTKAKLMKSLTSEQKEMLKMVYEK